VNLPVDANEDGNLTDRPVSADGFDQNPERAGGRVRLALRPETAVSALYPAAVTDGGLGRNTFRAANLHNLDVALVKRTPISETVEVVARLEAFNAFDREQFGIPVRIVGAPSFGQAVNIVAPGRVLQFAIKLRF
jgi:hypothetical protein